MTIMVDMESKKSFITMQEREPFAIIDDKFPNVAYFFTVEPQIFTRNILKHTTQSEWSVAHQLVRDGYVPYMSDSPENPRTQHGFDCGIMSMTDNRGVSVLEVGLLAHPEIWLERVIKNKKSWRCISKTFLPKILERVLKYVALHIDEKKHEKSTGFCHVDWFSWNDGSEDNKKSYFCGNRTCSGKN